MALITCTECGKEFSEKASACPNCGCPTEEILKELATVSTADNEVPRYEIDEKTIDIAIEKGIVNEPFLIINADDYYGKVAFKKLHDFLIEDSHRNSEFTMAMAGFILKNTLSDNGTVTRGICVEDEAGYLHRVIETKGIIRNNQGTIDCDTEESKDIIQENNRVSMNMWAGYPDFIQVLDERFAEFLKDEAGDPLKKEYLLPNIVGDLLKEGNVDVKVLETHDKWIGITYKEDTELAQAGFRKMTEDGVYPEKLWN